MVTEHFFNYMVSERISTIYTTEPAQKINEKNSRVERESTAPYIVSLQDIKPEMHEYVGGKASNLAILTQAGLPVPPGYAITTNAYDYYTENQVLPDGLLQDMKDKKAALGGKVALRSSATCEDGEALSMAGVFTTFYITDDNDVERGLYDIYHQSQSDEVREYLGMNGIGHEEIKMGVVLQKLIEPQISGVVYTGVNGNDLLIQYVDGFGERLVDGQTHGSAVLIDTESSVIKESSNFDRNPLFPNEVNALGSLAAQVKQVFPQGDQDIEFAIQGQEVHLLQSRALTARLENVRLGETPEETLHQVQEQFQRLAQQEKDALHTSAVVFSDSNYSELLPRPKEMDFGIFAYIFTGSDGIPGAIQLGRREMGYEVPDKNIDYTHFVGGRPYFTIGMDALTYYAGFPDTEEAYLQTFVEDYMGQIQDDPEKGHYPEMGLYVQDPTFQQLQEKFGDSAPEHYSRYLEFKKTIATYAEDFQFVFQNEELPGIEQFIQEYAAVEVDSLTSEQLVSHVTNGLEHLRTVSCVDFVKAARLGFYYSQKLQAELQTTVGMDEVSSAQAYGTLTQGLEGSMITDVNQEIFAATTDEEAYSLAQNLVGHYSTGEMLEVRHERLKDDPQALRSYVDGIRSVEDYASSFEKQRNERKLLENDVLAMVPEDKRDEIARTISSAQRYMALRETVKYYFVREYSVIRDGLEQIEERLHLPEGAIYHVYPREIAKLVEDPKAIEHVIKSRGIAFENYASLDLPNVITENDIASLQLDGHEQETFTELKGKFLANGDQFDGVVVNLEDFDTGEEINRILNELREGGKQIILVATQMNLSHDPFIAMADGIILQNAGIVSHGAQRARELGRGALGGIKTSYLKTGMELNFDPSNLMIRNLQTS